jgi:hypothetical protein
MLRDAPLDALWLPLLLLAVLGAVVFTLSMIRFRRDLAPARAHPRAHGRHEAETGRTGAAKQVAEPQ